MLVQSNKLKISSLIAAIAIAILGGASASAWGPQRQTYTIQRPADKVTFNSMTNNPNHGDERNFTLARRVDEGANQWRDDLEVTGDAEYVVRIYVHNNAAENLNLVARNVRASVSIPSAVSNNVTLQGQISADNATPNKIWDQVVFKSSSKKFNIAYIAGSARYFTNVNPNAGFQIPDSLSSNAGAQLGYDKMDGNISGCFQFSGILTFRVKVTTQKTSSFNATKQVRKLGETEWKKSISAKPGDTVEYLLGYENNGEVEHRDVNVRDILPNGVSYVNNSTILKNSSYPNGNNVANNDIATRGVGIGGYLPGANAFIKITAKIADAKNLKCGVNTLTNVVRISTPNGAKENTATVTVNRDCTPTERDFCQVIGKTHLPKNDPKCFEPCKIPGKENLKKDDPKCKEFCTVKGKETLPKNDPKCFEPCQIKGKEHLKKDDPKCFDPCLIKGKEDLKKDDPKCNDPCPIKGKENLKANDPNCFAPCEIKGKENLKSTDANCVPPCRVNGKENLKSTDVDCFEPCRIQGKENLRNTDPLCGEIPAELPKTGPMEAAMMIIAIMAISGAIAYWFRSHEEMKKATSLIGAKKSKDEEEK